MGRAIGIDLGTTNTAVAVIKDGRPHVLEDERGYKVLPSCVSMKDDGRFLVGQAARQMLLTRPNYTVYAVKRLMGRRFDSPEVEAIKGRLPFEVRSAPDGGCLIRMGDQQYTPVEVSALILQVARGIAEHALGEPVDEAVITVPAYFNHAQRNATFEAARIAGLKCERLLNEPTSAALAYGFRKDLERTILIYDLGGGTFDVSVLRLSQGVYEILSTRGDTFLGGEDLDHRVVDHLANHFEATHKIDLREDRTALQRLKDASERAKCELSFTDRTTVLIPRVTPTQNLEQVITRLTLETLVEDLVQRTLETVRKAVTEGGLKLSDIDDVILVGGQTRMPRIREAISTLFKKEPSRSIHPEEAVAIGAAVHAASLDNPDAKTPVLLDVTPFDLGIDVVGGLFQPVITRNSQVPATAARVFATAVDNQEAVRVTVRQGYSRAAGENEFLGEFVLSGLSPAPRMQTKVEVNFRLDSNGMLHVQAVEQGTGERKRITVRNYAEVVSAKAGAGFEVDGDVAAPREPKAAPASRVTADGLGGEESTAGVQLDGKGRAGRLAGFFSRMARRSRSATQPPAAGAGEAGAAESGAEPIAADLLVEASDEIQDLPVVKPEALDDLPVLDTAHILAPVSVADVLEGVPSIPKDLRDSIGGGMETYTDPEDLKDAKFSDEMSLPPVGVGRPKNRIVLPNIAPQRADELGHIPRMPGFASAEYEGDPESTVNTVAVFGLAGESPSWERPRDESGHSGAAVAAGPVTRGPAIPSDGGEQKGGKWDFGLDIGEAPGADDDFERLFTALESSLEPGMRPSTPTLAPPPDSVEPAPPQRPSLPPRRPISAPHTPAPVSPTRTAPRVPPPPPPAEGRVDLPSLDDLGAGEMPSQRAVEELFALAGGLFSDDELARPTLRPAAAANPAAPARRPSAPASEFIPRTPVLPDPPRKPARLKLAYPRVDALLSEMRDNLRRGGCFVRTEKPLSVGREVQIELNSPGLATAVLISGVVSGGSASGVGQAPGMTIEYRLTPEQRRALEQLVAGQGG